MTKDIPQIGCVNHDCDRCAMLDMEIKALEEKLAEARAQPEHEFVRGECVKCGASIERQEPVAWMGTDVDGNPNKFRLNFFSGAIPLFTTLTDRSLIANNEKNGSPCPEFWDWLPKAYNFDGDGTFTKYNMEVAFLAGKRSVATNDRSQERVDETVKQRHEQEPVRVPVTDNTYNYAKSLAEAIFKQHFASDEHYASGRILWGVNDTVIGILTQIDNMVADMVRRPAQQQKEGFASPGGGYVPAIPRPIPLDWKFVPKKATPEMLRAMDECAQEGYDERLYEGMASSVYMAAWDASPVLGTLPTSKKEMSIMDMIVGNLVREGINKHRARELAEHFIKQCNYTNGYCTGRTDLLAEQKAQQPVAWMYDVARYGPDDVRGQQWRPAISRIKPRIHDSLVRDMTPLYTFQQPNKSWVGLTQQDINIAFDDTQEGGGFDDFARAIEAKLKEKNT